MKVRTKTTVTAWVIFLLALQVSAATIHPLPEPGFFANLKTRFEICKFNIKCYFTTQLGSTITTINATDTIRNSRSVINDNFANLNGDKMEKSTTTLYQVTAANSITSASALATVGTITSGTWQGSVIDVARQGTGTTSPSQYQAVVGNGSLGLTVASSTGTSGQSLKSNGASAYPSWQDDITDQAANYTWTGTHTFNNETITSSTTARG